MGEISVQIILLGRLFNGRVDMSATRIVASLLLCGVILFQAPEATAAGGLLGTCAKILRGFVGKHLAIGALEATGGIVAEHFAGKGKKAEAGQVTVSEQDVRQLEQRFRQQGLSDCELREQLQALEASTREAPQRREYARGYSAIAYCSRTGVTGRSYDQETRQDAIEAAIDNCIDRGGIPECCEDGARLVR